MYRIISHSLKNREMSLGILLKSKVSTKSNQFYSQVCVQVMNNVRMFLQKKNVKLTTILH